MTDTSDPSSLPLDDEALKPADQGGLVERMIIEARAANAATEAQKPRKGRPVGSRNRSTVERPTGQARLVVPPARTPEGQPKLTPEQEAQQARIRREVKKQRSRGYYPCYL